MLGVVDARGGVVVQRRRVLAAQRGDDAGEDHDQSVAARVDDAGIAQRGEQLGTALDGLLARDHRLLERGGDRAVLGLGGGLGVQADTLGVALILGGDPLGHLAGHREDRALGGAAHGGVGTLGGVLERGGDQRGIDQLTRAGDELLGGAADQL